MSVIAAIGLKCAYYSTAGRCDYTAHAALCLLLTESILIGMVYDLDGVTVKCTTAVAGRNEHVALSSLTAYKSEITSRRGIDTDTLNLVISMLVRDAIASATVKRVLEAERVNTNVRLGNYAQKLFLCAILGAALVSIAL